jgi:hypothetical protein
MTDECPPFGCMKKGRCTCPPAEPPFTAMVSVECPVHGDEARALAVEAIDTGRAIMAQPPGRCEDCGTVAETRPYGPNGENVCFDCGTKDEEAMKRAFERRMGWAA